jgi:hypothetical protein
MTPPPTDGGLPFGPTTRPDVVDLVSTYLEGDALALCAEGNPDCGLPLPRRSYELFREIDTFDPDRHCVRLWELERLNSLLEQIESFCTCQPVDVDDDGQGPITSTCCP